MMTTSFTDIAQTLEIRKNIPLLNTSYPIARDKWLPYIKKGELHFEHAKPMGFYIHIPFCQKICSFCEYTKTCLPSKSEQIQYVNKLISDINQFINRYPGLTIYGLDIGGGTPTSLCDAAFVRLINEINGIIRKENLSDGFEPSIEATFQTLTDEKIRMIVNAGISRISLGVQSSVKKVMYSLNRNSENIDFMKSRIDKMHECGVHKVNLDFMYGLPDQNMDTIQQDIEVIRELLPDQITVYEFRTNQLAIKFNVDNESNFNQYSFLYKNLLKIGYNGQLGQNTFSMDAHDNGLSSYLSHRMFDGWQYKGFGLSAQSMSKFGISYNKGKNSHHLSSLLQSDSFEADTYYNLPQAELLSKFIAVSGYSGGFSLSAAKELTGIDVKQKFYAEIKYLLSNDYAIVNGDRFQLTTKGFRYYGAIFSLFFRCFNYDESDYS